MLKRGWVRKVYNPPSQFNEGDGAESTEPPFWMWTHAELFLIEVYC